MIALKLSMASSMSSETREDILQEMEHVCNYLKYGFDSNICSNDISCDLHNIKFGLSEEGNAATIFCYGCKRSFYFFQRIKDYLLLDDDIDSSATDVIGDCIIKARLFMGHQLRVVNQQLAIEDINENMKHECEENGKLDKAVLVIDFKMKLEPVYFREKTLEHYGKRGMSWHGALVSFYSVEEIHSDDNNKFDCS